MTTRVVILAAGQGTRMHSALPKILHPLAGKPLLSHVCATAALLNDARPIVIYGHGGEMVPERLADLDVEWVPQVEQLGTGHAVTQALPKIPATGHVLILYGDVPLITRATLARLIEAGERSDFGLLTVTLDDPHGYGRILRNADGVVQAIVEEKDADATQRAIDEVNTGLMAVCARRLRGWLDRLQNHNAQGEYYLTDIVAMAVADGIRIQTVTPGSAIEVMGINDRVELARVERHYQSMQAEVLMRQGVTIIDPQRFDLRGELHAGRDVVLDVNVVLEGKVDLGDNVTVGANTFIRDTEIGAGVTILPNCVIEDARIGAGARIGPFARIRPQAQLEEDVHVGNFVEIKKSTIGKGSKINHLSYVGDSQVGSGVNIGAGTITCNYDGANKHQTVIGDDVFVGSGTELVAPLTVGDGATIGAGTTLTKDLDPGHLAVTRAAQQTVPGWRRPRKKPK